MKKSMLTGIIALALMVVTLGTTIGSAAGSSETWSTRGVKYLCWSKDDIYWNYNSSSIKSVSKYQTRSGILVNLNGISKEKARSTSKSHSYLCKHTLLAGAQIGGVTIGYAMNVNDRVVIKNTGKASWKYDV